ncbi:hypothetical protein [Brachybacterium ginsengisoli]|uniref:hypothetical protein n=1 Tax=Brachybacterium ginsengisoli TaxID=1331682 RepID=UPI00125F21A9|nr:hypothetical protein [Brachybacterium ginsengisoli]
MKYQWLVGGAAQKGATTTTFTVPSSAVGKSVSIRCVITARGYQTLEFTEEFESRITLPGLSPWFSFGGSAYGFDGLYHVGARVTAALDGVPKGARTTYQWGLNGTNVKGATKSYFDIPLSAAGKKLSLRTVTSAKGYEVHETETLVSSRLALREMRPSMTFIGASEAIAGGYLSADPRSMPRGAKVTYQWRLGGGNVKGATDAFFSIPASAGGKELSVSVVATATGYMRLERVFSAGKVKGSTAKTLKAATPTISGTARVGSKLTAKAGSWSSGTKLTYQWSASGVAIKGATKSTFTLTSAQAGKTVTVTVRGTKSGYTSASKKSKATAKVAWRALTTATPKISGTARVGSKLTAKAGSWTSGTTLSYQWYANGVAIKGATKSTLVLPSSAVGKQITVKVTGRKSGYATASKTSGKTAKVAAKKR